MAIPHTIHQTWKTAGGFPSYFRPEWLQSWRDNHPSWSLRLWTDADLRKLAADKYPDHLPVFDQPQKYPGVVRGDLGRLMVLDQFGGVYADLDYFSLRPLDPLTDVTGRTFIGAEMPTMSVARHVPNAFIGSIPGHPILRDTLASGLSLVRQGTVNVSSSYGWFAFFMAFRAHRRDAGVYAAPPKELCPFSWMPLHYEQVHNERYLSAGELRALHPEAYAVHFWETDWGSGRRKRLDQDENTPAFPPKAQVHSPESQAEAAPDLKPLPQKEWPAWAKAIARARSLEDNGVGDTVERLLGKDGEKFKKWYLKLTGKSCGCDRRKAEWNTLYPYLPKISEG